MADMLLPPTKHDVYPFIDVKYALKGGLKGKTALITGAAGGIGQKIALTFALAAAANVILTTRTSPLTATSASIAASCPDTKVHTRILDVSSEKSVDELFESLAEEKGGPGVPDVLVNNAAHLSRYVGIVESDPKEWGRDLDINLKGVYLMCRRYLIALAGKPGVILNSSSGAVLRTGPGLSGYSAAKSGINRLTEYINAEHSAQGVTAIAYHPGGVADSKMGKMAPDFVQPHLIDQPDLAAGTCLYLCQKRAEYLRGRFVLSWWDMEELEKVKERILERDLLKTRPAMS